MSFDIFFSDIIQRVADVMLIFGFMHIADATAVRNNAQLTFAYMSVIKSILYKLM